VADVQDFATVYRRYIAPIYRYMYAHTSSTDDAEDLTATVFQRAPPPSRVEH
jgi:DNA-directed RNA polymerase specialized sigma24 family protein